MNRLIIAFSVHTKQSRYVRRSQRKSFSRQPRFGEKRTCPLYLGQRERHRPRKRPCGYQAFGR